METAADLRALENGGFVDYMLLRNSCITYVKEIMDAGGVDAPMSSLFTDQDIRMTGETWLWSHPYLADVPRFIFLSPLHAIEAFASEIGFLPADNVPIMSMSAHQIERLLGRPFNGTRADLDLINYALAEGTIDPNIGFAHRDSADVHTAPFDPAPEKLVLSTVSSETTEWFATTIRNDQIERVNQFSITGEEVEILYDSFGFSEWESKLNAYDVEGNVEFGIIANDDGTVGGAQWQGVNFDVAQLGAQLGSQIGQLLGGNSLAGRIAAGTIIGTVGLEIGKLLRHGTIFTPLSQGGPDGGPSSLEFSFEAALHQFGFDLGGQLRGQVINAVSSLLVGELAEALGLEGFEAGLFQTAGTTITTQLINNLGNFLASGGANPHLLFAGFDPSSLLTSLSGPIAGFLGNQLAAEIVLPESTEAAIAGSLASMIGAWAASALLTPIFGPILGNLLGSFVGSFVGNLLGTLIGNAFEDIDKAWAYVQLDPLSGQLILTGLHAEGDGSFAAFEAIGQAQADAVNGFVEAIGARIDPLYSTAFLEYRQRKDDFWLNGPEGELFLHGQVTEAQQLMPMVERGLESLLKHIALAGGDILLRRAFENSAALTPAGIAADLMVAQDYRTYLDNAPIINAIMAMMPESSFSTGWALTLLRARALGLDTGSPKDFQGGIASQLREADIPDKLDWAPSFDASEPDTLVLTDGEGRQYAVDNAFGPGLTKAVAGTAGNDGIDLAHLDAVTRDGAPVLYAVTHVAAGAGADSVNGSASTDLIDGGDGNDILNGRGGHDWVFGGDGSDTLYGGAGDDLIAGGAGNDTLHNEAGHDSFAGGVGDDLIVINDLSFTETVFAAVKGAGQQTDIIRFGAGIYPSIAFTREGADLRIGNPISMGSSALLPTLLVKDFFLTASAIDRFEFANGSVRLGADLWRELMPDETFSKTLPNAGGGYRTINFDGNFTQAWSSVVSEYDASSQLLQQVHYMDDGTASTGYGAADDLIYADAGAAAYGVGGDDVIYGTAAADLLAGGAGADLLHGRGGADSLHGEDGDDVLEGGADADTLNGGSGNDIASYAGAAQGVIARLDLPQYNTYEAYGDQYIGIERLRGSRFADHLTGDAGANRLEGGGGGDTLDGSEGDDLLFGNTGNDILDGGAGADTLDGGTGTDSGRFRGTRAQYTLTDLGSGSVRVVGPDGDDTVNNVERLVFDDQTVTWPPGAPAGSVAIDDVSVTEGNAGTQLLTFTITRSGGTAAFAVSYATANNSAFSGGDYVATSGTLSFGSNVNTQTISITINGDTTVESTETFFVNLSGATNSATISDAQGIGTIVNDDVPNSAPVITSDGGGDTVTLARVENAAAVTTVVATDPDGNPLTYSVVGGADAARFEVNATTGALSFIAAPNFEAPTDSDANNSYIVQVEASDGSLTDTQTITVNIINLSEVPSDFNGDFRSDFLWRHDSGAVATWELNGGTILAGHDLPGLPTTWSIVGNGDFNADGRSDILWHHDNGALRSWQINGGEIVANDDLGGLPSTWQVTGIGDFNGDRTNEVLWRHENGEVQSWEVNGGQVGATHDLGGLPSTWAVVGVADFNGDGTSDILWRHVNGALRSWEMNGGQIATNNDLVGLPTTWTVAGVGDFNGDSRSDVVWRHFNGALRSWEVDGGQIVANNDLGGLPSTWQVEGFGDFNGDGRSDIAWRHDNGGVATWEMNGGTILAGRDFPALPTSWHLDL